MESQTQESKYNSPQLEERKQIISKKEVFRRYAVADRFYLKEFGLYQDGYNYKI